MKPRVSTFWLPLVALVLAITGNSHAQTATTGQITGTVRDATGAIIPDAKIVVRSSTGQTYQTTSDAQGFYRLNDLGPGAYSVIITAPGFSERDVTGVIVRITQSSDVPSELTVGPTSQVVQVQGQAPLLQTQDATTGRVIDQAAVHELPLPTRNYEQLLSLSPGTVSVLPNNTDLGEGDSDVDVNGQEDTGNNFQFDGTQVNIIGTNITPVAVPSPDAIQEFIVQTSLYDATQGRNTGGNMDLVTKTGTNQFHGDAFEFFRNEALNANDFFLNRSGQKRPVLRRNQFGGTLGGPVFKNKTFFFLSYQGDRETNGASTLNSISYLNMPTGLTNDRSANTLNRYASSIGVPTINPTALALLQAKLPDGQYAIPNASPNGTQSCSAPLVPSAQPVCVAQTALSSISTFRENQFNANYDQNIGTGDHFFARVFSSNMPEFQAISPDLGEGAYQAPGYGGVLNFRNRVISLDETHIFNQSLINDAHFGFSRVKSSSYPQEPFTNAQFGINNPIGKYPGMSTIEVLGLFTIGSGVLAQEISATGTFQASDMITYTHGGQNIRIGGDALWDNVNLFFASFSRGEMLVNSFPDFLLGGTAPNPATGQLDTITGLLGNGVPNRNLKAFDADGFFQDDIQVNNNVTLNAGVRMQRYGGFSDIDGRLVNFDVNTFLQNNTAACTLAAPCNAPGNGFMMLHGNQTLNPNQVNVAPRFGFAIKPVLTKNLVIRGGFGLYFDRFSARIADFQIFNYPYDIVGVGLGSLETSYPDLSGIKFPLAPVVPSPIPFYYYGVPLTGLQTPISGLYVSKNFASPRDYQYNLNVQYEPFHNWMMEIGYMGSKGDRIISAATLNQTDAPPVLTASGFSQNKVLNGLDEAESNASSNYNALQASLTKRFENHLQFLAAYTYSKSLDTDSGAVENELAAEPGDQNNLSTQYGPSDFDETQRFVFSGIYDAGKVYKGNNRLLSEGANNWASAMIATFQTGMPFSVTCVIGSTIDNRADLVPGEKLTRPGSTESKLNEYFNTNAFSNTCINEPPYGTSSRNLLRAPGQHDVDVSIIKRFSISQQSDLEFRSEFFNVFNFVNFAPPNNNMAAPGAGAVVATSAGPRIIQIALKFNF